MFIIFAITIFLLGVSIGSFFNLIIDRLKRKEKITGRSKCEKCHHALNFFDLFPVLSYVFLGGKCRYCKKRIGIQYLLIELSVGLLFLVCFLTQFRDVENLAVITFSQILIFVRNLIVVTTCVSIFVYDIRYMEIPDEIVIPSSIIVLLINIFLTRNYQVFLIGSVVGLFFFFSQFYLSKGKWIGGGDMRIGFLIGAIFGSLEYVFITIFLGYILGAIYSLPILFKKYVGKNKNVDNVVPLGPFLSVSILLVLFILRFFI